MEKLHETKELDLKKASKGIWLVKVPKYLSEAWHNGSPGSEIGKLKIYNSGSASSTRAVFTINDTTQGQSKVPLDHEFIMRKDIGDQQLSILSMGMIPSDSQDPNSTLIPAGAAAIEGQVKQRCEFKPRMSDDYVQLSRKRVEASNKPVREVIQIQGTVTNFKPKANHDFNIEYENKKKEEGKKVRADKDKVMDMLFSAFEKHQYYNIKDLGKITNQPMAYLKEILREICTYNVKAPYKNTWELKKEFRHYRGDSANSSTTTKRD